MVPLIIFQFTCLSARDALYKVRSRLKNFTIEDIGLGSQGKKVLFQQGGTYYTNVMSLRRNANFDIFGLSV